MGENIILKYQDMPSVAQNFSTRKDEALNQKQDLKIGQCEACGLVQLIDFIPVPYYKKVIRSSSVSLPMREFRNQQFQSFSERYNLRDKNYLELGCGYGEYLEIMAHYIKNTKGIEFSSDGVKKCIEKSLNVEKAYLDEAYTLNSAKFDSFGIFNFLEHIPNPVDYLKNISSILSSDAIGIVEVPNFDVMQSEHVYCDFSTEHIAYYDRNTLRTTLALSGFDVIEIKDVWHGDILSATVKKRRQFMPLEYQSMLEKQKDILQEITSDYEENEIVVWGAGHQSLTSIKQLKIESKVQAIVDSAPAKQMKYSPASGIPIYPPNWLKTKNVKLLLINASSYSDEVVTIVRKEFSNIKRVVIVRNGRVKEVEI